MLIGEPTTTFIYEKESDARWSELSSLTKGWHPPTRTAFLFTPLLWVRPQRSAGFFKITRPLVTESSATGGSAKFLMNDSRLSLRPQANRPKTLLLIDHPAGIEAFKCFRLGQSFVYFPERVRI